MFFDSSQTLFFLEMLIFALVIFMHLSKKSSSVINFYMLQSLVVSGMLFISAEKEASLLMVAVAIITLIVKVIVAPNFFRKLIDKNHIKFSAKGYLNVPLTLIVLAVLTAFSYSSFFSPLVKVFPGNDKALLLAIATMFIAIFLLINRKGALSQAIGILTLENGIVSFAFLSGLEQTPGLQLGIIFDILIWTIIASTLTSMIYKQIDSLDVSAMQRLKEE